MRAEVYAANARGRAGRVAGVACEAGEEGHQTASGKDGGHREGSTGLYEEGCEGLGTQGRQRSAAMMELHDGAVSLTSALLESMDLVHKLGFYISFV